MLSCRLIYLCLKRKCLLWKRFGGSQLIFRLILQLMNIRTQKKSKNLKLLKKNTQNMSQCELQYLIIFSYLLRIK